MCVRLVCIKFGSYRVVRVVRMSPKNTTPPSGQIFTRQPCLGLHCLVLSRVYGLGATSICQPRCYEPLGTHGTNNLCL